MNDIANRSRARILGLLAGLTLCLGAQAQSDPACKSADPQLPPAAVERWMARQVPPSAVLLALARAGSKAVWIDEIAISAGQALVKGHAEAGDPSSALSGLVRGLQMAGSGVRDRPNTSWLGEKGLPSQSPATAKFLLDYRVADTTPASGRDAVPCTAIDALLAEIIGRGRMAGGPIMRFGPRPALVLDDGLPVQFVDLQMGGTFASLTRALMTWEAMPFALALDGVVMAPLGDELEVALTIKIVRGVSVSDAFPRQGPAGATAIGPDPFRVAEAVRARRLASPAAPCQERAKAWQAMAGQLNFVGVMPLGAMGLFRLPGSTSMQIVPAGQVHGPSGARAVSFGSAAAELEIAEMIDGECRLRLIDLPIAKR